MLMLLFITIFYVVACAHRYLQSYAPSNLLVRRVRAREPRRRTAAMVAAIAVGLLLTMHLVAVAIASGAPRWLNLMALVLAWDAIKISLLAVLMIGRTSLAMVKRVWRSVTRSRTPASALA